MKNVLLALALLLPATAAIPFFKFDRPVEVPAAGQHYAVVDESIWSHARADLGDLRLYSSGKEVPFALTVERGGLHNEEVEVRVLQPSTIAGKTQCILDMNAIPEYDHIDLKLSTKDFVAHATVEGQDDLHGSKWANLGGSIIYDLSHDRLGGNTTLRLPRTTFKYLRITMDGPVKPADVQGATAAERQEEQAVLRQVGGAPSIEQQGRDTVLTFTIPRNVPVERLNFLIDPAQPNFRRPVEIRGAKNDLLSSDEISRVHLLRSGRKIDSEDTDVDFSAGDQKTIKVIIHNGDDPPLKLAGVQLQQYERRIYFNAPAQGGLELYYGDEKLDRPIYDYAKFFQKEGSATATALGPEQANAAFTGRPDERPWTERHPQLLWIAIIAAVLVLGAMAVRSMKAAAA